MKRFRTEQWLPYPVDFVFGFFANPANLPQLLPPWQRARIEEIELHPAPRLSGDHRASVAAGAGTRLTLSLRPVPLSPLRVSWNARIENFQWNDHFCDRQLSGPFRHWRQCHRMQACESPRTGEPGTLLIDTVEYELPFGRLGRTVNRLAAQRLIAGVFRHRHHRTIELLRELSGGEAPHA